MPILGFKEHFKGKLGFPEILDHLNDKKTALFIKQTMKEGVTFRQLASICSEAWGASFGDNQIAGVDILEVAGYILKEDPYKW